MTNDTICYVTIAHIEQARAGCPQNESGPLDHCCGAHRVTSVGASFLVLEPVHRPGQEIRVPADAVWSVGWRRLRVHREPCLDYATGHLVLA